MQLFLLSTGLKLGKYALIFITSVFKYLLGVAMTFPAKFSFLELLLTAGLGGCVGIMLFTFFGSKIIRLIELHLRRNKTLPFKVRRRIVKVWRRFGIVGVAVLTPFLSPPIAVAIALSFHTKPRKTVIWLCGSVIAWSLLFALFRDQVAALTGW
ncbi:MAG: hypothetical protein R3B47_03735 [Bacteroidia bacterium]